ncbi:cytolysin [Schizophyllum commune]
MNGTGDISLNAGIAAEYQWWSYNTTIGKPYVLGRVPKDISREEVAWSYDNSKNSQEFTDEWTESWTNSNSATLTVTNSATITLSASITIEDVASSGFEFTISTETSSTETKETSHELSHTWTLSVGPGEKLTLYRVISTVGETVEYGQDFGIADGSLLGTKGDKYAGHYYWGMYVNTLCNAPRGRLDLHGSSKNVTYTFKLVRETKDGKKVATPLPVDAYQAKDTDAAILGKETKWAKDSKAVFGDGTAQVMIAAPGDE